METRLRAAAEYAAALGHAPVYVSLFGSQNYGLAVASTEYRSDYDYKCVVLPSLSDLVEERKPVSKTIETPEGQIDIKDIRVFADILCRMNPSYLECLASDAYLALPGGEGMGAMRALLPRLMAERGAMFARVCCGLFEEKGRQMRHPYPSVVDKIARYGYDGKQVHHMYRLLLTLRAFEESGEFRLTVPEGEKPLLTDLKLNRVPLEDAERMIDAWRGEMRMLQEKIAKAHPEQGNAAADEIRRIARQMMYDHCADEVRREAR